MHVDEHNYSRGQAQTVFPLFTFRLLSRLALPICLNYLYIIDVVRLDQDDIRYTPQTAFAKVS